VLGKDPKKAFVVIDEVETDNCGVEGEQITVIRKGKGNPSPPANTPLGVFK
jgi:4-oxalocrotonate tautomerase